MTWHFITSWFHATQEVRHLSDKIAKCSERYNADLLISISIHDATDTPATRLSTFLVKSLNNILTHVLAHLKNTQEFIDFISTLHDIKGFCSLDVCNLYGSIPLEDLEDGTHVIFTIMKDFFSTHKTATDLQHLSDDDLSLIHI